MEEQDLKELLKFSEEFREKKKVEENKLPYHVNIIDELHINENGHSRILTKLLQYKNEKNEYEILQSLLDYTKQKNFWEIEITNPTITQEKKRIDLWVRDDNYAIIFENKVYNAEDQEAQICRYIETTKKEYEEEQIFVVYISRDGKEPDSQSWGEYKERFKSRYINLSFRHDILPWLKSKVIPNVRQKDVFLSSALLQYVDYLEGNKMFRTGSIYKGMNMELNKLIEKYSQSEGKDKIASLIEKREALQDVLNQMESLKNSYFEELYGEWRTNTKRVFENLEPSQNGYWPITQVTIEKFMECENVNVSISGGHTDPYGNFYVGIAPLPKDKREMVREELKKSEIELPNENQGIHRCFGLREYKEAYSFFEKLVNECQKLK